MSTGHKLIEFGRQFYDRGWMEGTGGNLSLRMKDKPLEIVITPSGVNKGYLHSDDLITIRNGKPLNSPNGYKPSYETPIHLAIYKAVPWAKAVFHIHPVYAVVLSERYGDPNATRLFRLEWIEILKAMGFGEGQAADVPVLANRQDVARVGEEITRHLRTTRKPVPGFILYNHGLTVWGRDVEEARNHLEVLEYACHLHYKKLNLNQ